MEEGLFYSGEALINRVLFLSDSNDINVFVEDECKEFEYENILNRMFAYRITIKNIFPMKGKPGVRKAFEEYGSNYEGKPSIYIVDDDFDTIMDRSKIKHPNYVYLNKYNIESYYVDESVVMRFMAGKMKKRQRDIVAELSYDVWKNNTYQNFEELFINYVIAQRVFPSEKNVGISPYKYLDSEGNINHDVITQYISDLKTRVQNYDELYDYYMSRYNEYLEGDASNLICGKYVLASLARYLRKKANVNFKEDDFRYYLVSEFDIKKLNFLKERMLNILQQSA